MGPGMRVLEEVGCPECGTLRPLGVRGGGPGPVYFYCPSCLPQRVRVAEHIPGLPSDLTYMRNHGERLVAAAFEKVRNEIQARRAARDRATDLLREHLTEHQWFDVRRGEFFDVPSKYSEEIIYRVRLNDQGAIVEVIGRDLPVIDPRVRSTEPYEETVHRFACGLKSVPLLGQTIRTAALAEFRTWGSVPLCLRILGPWLPVSDYALGFKLFLESDEVRAWIKGMRMHLGQSPEEMVFVAPDTGRVYR